MAFLALQIFPYTANIYEILFHQKWHQLGSQGYKIASAIEAAQVIAARTYIYQRIQYASQYGTPNNPTSSRSLCPTTMTL